MSRVESLEALVASLGLENTPKTWQECWEESQQRSPERLKSFLRDTFSSEVGVLVPICPDALEALAHTAKDISSDDELLALLGLWHFLLFHSSQVPGFEIADWPLPSARLGDQAALFSSVALLSGVRHTYSMHESLGIPPEVTSYTLSDIDIWLRDYFDKHGAWGMEQAGWMLLHFTGRLFWLGRLQFRAEKFGPHLRAYRNNNTGKVLALLETGAKVRRDGQIDGSNGICDCDAWTAELVVDDGVIRGYPVSHLGSVSSDPVEIRSAEWNQVLGPGDAILEVHIPASGKMDYDECGASFRSAVEFYHRHLPGYDFAAFTCISWLLDPQLGKILPAESNIVRFLSEYYLFPVKSDDSQTFVRVFGEKPVDLASAPRNTGLQRAILDYSLAGNQFRMGGGFILTDDLDWGHAPYRSGKAEI
jgi:hypothetical protein